MSAEPLSDEYDEDGLWIHGPQRAGRASRREESVAERDARLAHEEALRGAVTKLRAKAKQRRRGSGGAAGLAHAVQAFYTAGFRARPITPAVPDNAAPWHPRFVPRGPAAYTPEQVAAARRAYNRARQRGTLTVASACECCDRTGLRIHGHHTDYTKPLDVMWLCTQCHRMAHGFARPAHLLD